MKLHFIRHGNWGIVSGTELRPKLDQKEEVDKFERRNAGALADLLLCLTGKIRDLALEYDNVSEAWQVVTQLCGVKEENELQAVEEEIEQLKFEDTALSLLSTLKALYTKLEKLGGKATSNQKTLRLLRLLPEKYESFVIDVKTDKCLRERSGMYDFDKVAERLQQRALVLGETVREKAKSKTKTKKEDKNVVLKAKTEPRGLKCFGCGQRGHTRKHCPNCFNCGEAGHVRRDCPNVKNGQSTKRQVKVGKRRGGRRKPQKPASDESSSDESEESDSLASFPILMCKKGRKTSEAEGSDTVVNGNSHVLQFCLDSAASLHCTSSRQGLRNTRKLEKPYMIETLSSLVMVSEVGDVHGTLRDGTPIVLKDVAYDEKLRESFVLSTAALTNEKWSVDLREKHADIRKPNGKLFARVKKGEADLYWVDIVVAAEKAKVCQALGRDQLWHYRLGHPAYSTLQQLQRKGTANGLGTVKFQRDKYCDPCAEAKLSNKKVPKKTSVHKFEACRPLEKIHLDTAGPFPRGGNEGFKWFVHIVDDFSRYKWVYCVTKKRHIARVVIMWMRKLQRVTDSKIRNVKCDNGTEFLNKTVKEFLETEGIVLDTSAPGLPALNGAVERANRTVEEGMMTLLLAAGLKKWYWPFAVKTFVYLNNRMPTRTNADWRSPYQVLWGRKPDLSHCRIFGSKGYALDGRKAKKCSPSAKPAMLLGYHPNNRTYVVKWLSSGRVGVARSARWNEEAVVQKKKCTPRVRVSPTKRPDYYKLLELLDKPASEGQAGGQESVSDVEEAGDYSSEVGLGACDTASSGAVEDLSSTVSQVDDSEDVPNFCDVNEAHVVSGKRTRKPVQRYAPEGRSRALKTIVRLSKLQPPKKFSEIEHRDDGADWLSAYKKEIQSLEDVGGFEVIRRKEVPEGAQVLKILELFTEKHDGRKKCRIVVRGDLERGSKSKENYSPTADGTSIRLVAGLAASKGWPLRQLDVSTAYLYGRTSEPIFVELPEGHPKRDGRSMVYKTFSSVYGLKRAPKIWNGTLHKFLLSLGFKNCPVERCLYRRRDFYLLVYVDDLLYTARSMKEIREFEEKIGSKFKVRIEKEVTKFVGYEFEVTEGSVKLKQEAYIKKLVEAFGLEDGKSYETPMQSNLDLEKNNGKPLEDRQLYQGLLGALLFVNLGTRPEISFAVNQLSRMAKNPTITHLKLLKRVARYLKGSAGLGLEFKRAKEVELSLYVDSSWANSAGRKSIFGFTVLLNGTPVAFRSKQQSIVALSTTEAEYVGLCGAVRELLYVRNLLRFLGVRMKHPLRVMNDNQAALKIGENLSSVSRTKHIELKYFFVQDLVEEEKIKLEYVPTEDMVADIFTKALDKIKFRAFRDQMLTE